MRSRLVRLCPLWWLYVWACNSFVSHDCDLNPVRCRVTEPIVNTLAFLDWCQAGDDE